VTEAPEHNWSAASRPFDDGLRGHEFVRGEFVPAVVHGQWIMFANDAVMQEILNEGQRVREAGRRQADG